MSELLAPWVLIAMLAETSSLNEKRVIITAEGDAGNEVFFKGLQWAFSGFTTFGVREVSSATKDGSGLSWREFEPLLQDLDQKVLTGNAAIHEIEMLKSYSTIDQWNWWYKPILEKNFRAGFTGKSINEYVKLGLLHRKYRIDLFECMLAHPSEKHERKMKGRKLVDHKLDGIRMLAEVHRQGEVTLYSREGKNLTDKFPKIVAELSSLSLDDDALVFDGELMSSSFKETMRTANQKSTNEFSDAVFYMFTCLPLQHFKNGVSSWTEIERRNTLLDAIGEGGQSHIKALSYDLFDLDDPVQYKRFLKYNKDAIAAGFEGIMIKNVDAPYECKRSASWLKAKPFIELTLTVKGMYEGMHKYTGMLGGLSCEGEYEGKYIVVNVGSGFTDAERAAIWALGKGVINLLVEVRADAISVNENGVYSLRFPRFKTFRGTAPGELL
jgi:DNA ligase-1